MKKFLYSSAVLALIAGAFIGVSNANLDQCSTDSVIPLINNDDECYYEEVLLRDIDYPPNIKPNTLVVSAESIGSGTIVLKPRKNSGFPRLIMLGDTVVTNTRKKRTANSTSLEWDGTITLPYNSRPANKRLFFDESEQKDTGTEDTEDEENRSPVNVGIIGTYMIGQSNETFSFSQAAFISFLTDQQDGTQLWFSQETEDLETLIEDGTPENEIEWDFVRENYCVVENSVCTIKIEAETAINRISLVKPIYHTCPTIRIEHGRYTSAPECKIVCNEGYALPLGARQCVPESEVDNSQEDLTDKDNYSNPWSRTRQGYFRFRDTRGGQLTPAPGADDLSEVETEYVSDKNAAISGRTNKAEATNNDSSEIDDKGLWKKFQELVWTNDTTGQYHKSREEKAKKIENEQAQNNNNAEESKQQTPSFSQEGLLPSTGSGAFVALAIAGLATMGFALRRRR